jgi:hypothetical protein
VEVGGAMDRSAGGYASAAGRGNPDRVIEVLSGEYVFATERHRDLLEALALPAFAAGWGLSYLSRERALYDGPELLNT